MTAIVLPPGWTLVSLETTGSTNDEATERAAQGAAEGLVVWALAQAGGRGRRGRTWQSPRGNLYCSTVLRPACPAVRAAQLGFVAALAVVDTIAPLVPDASAVKVKWPNDVMVGGAKICGILAESAINAAGGVDHVVLGIGINNASHPPSERIGYAATSLAAQGSHRPVSDLLSRLLQALHRRYGVWKTGGFGAMRQDWLARAASLGQPISIRIGDNVAEGRFAGIDADGALLLEEASGLTRRIAAGEITPQA